MVTHRLSKEWKVLTKIVDAYRSARWTKTRVLFSASPYRSRRSLTEVRNSFCRLNSVCRCGLLSSNGSRQLILDKISGKARKLIVVLGVASLFITQVTVRDLRRPLKSTVSLRHVDFSFTVTLTCLHCRTDGVPHRCSKWETHCCCWLPFGACW